MGLQIIAGQPTVKLRASTANGQLWLDQHVNPLAETWDRGWLVLTAEQAAHLAAKASFDRLAVHYHLQP